MSFFNRVKKLFNKYYLSEEESNFIKLNSQQWSDLSRPDSVGSILIEGFLDSPTSIVEKARLAKAAQVATGLPIKVFVRGLVDRTSNVIPIYKSFKIEEFYNWWRNYVNPNIVFPAIVKTLIVVFVNKTGERLVNYSINNLQVGDLIYDSLVRNIPNSYSIKKLNIFTHGRIIFRAFCFYYSNKKIIQKNNASILVTSHNVYSEYGMMCRQIHHHGGIVLLKDMDVYKLYTPDGNINEHFLKIKNDDFDYFLKNSDMENEKKYFMSRVLGINDQVDVINAYKDKKKYSREETLKITNKLDKDKKNVFVMAHAFSDAPHVGEGILFLDYYDFLEKTLIRLNGNENINCFVKSHPSSYMWGEKGGVETIIEQNNLNRIVILPSDYSSASIIDSADYIVTAKGTAGIEFSCAGIPAVTAGKGYYYGFGICIEPNDVEEYYRVLDDITNIEPLDHDKIKRAHIVLYHSFNNLYHSDVLPKRQIRPGDDYNSLFRLKYKEMGNNIQSGINMKDDFYNKVIDDVKRARSE
ncbi:Capsule polysaccharide biosynthesis protein [Vibrio xiamenensis]|uniref:Capsule polysaccharide biosynthesis protein n=1 Tax=Vibrio xiamenensis TaxID=861298 RepID=A0A1G8EXV3_9VIBR|nr:hypothetical protein [Vibrio xiamenensis]SDH74733.1 Capsule polysaccharide biosynthesis protein [Vibrio xiamenensis]